MKAPIDWVALSVFVVLFLVVTGMGFFAARWKRTGTLAHLDEWGLGGRQFGAWVTWFLVGGDFYTAYTMIAVPALVYALGAYGFFALPYTIIVYPIVFLLMPPLWAAAKRGGHVTAADVVQEHYGSRYLELAVAVTGVLATMPYIALQLVGMGVVIKALGLPGELPLVAAFVILALYTYSSGLRAPALIAFVKDILIYIVVLAAIAIIPMRLGGYAHVFAAAGAALGAKHSWAGLVLAPGHILPYATLALGSALAAFMYPHTLTGIFAAKSEDVIKRNAVFLPIYTLLLGLIALLGYMAYAAGVKVTSPNDVVPMLFKTLFSSWFTGFAFAAIAIGALVPAAVMSIGAGQSVHPQFLEGLCQSGGDVRRGGPGRQDCVLGGQGGGTALCPLPSAPVCNRSAAARGALDIADIPGGGVWIVHQLVQGAGFDGGLGGWFLRRHVYLY